MSVTTYLGKDDAGALWARAAVVNDDGTEHAELHVSVRVGDEGRTATQAMGLARLLLSTLLHERGVAMPPGAPS